MIMVVPAVRLDTKPVPDVMVATAGSELLQVPPATASFKAEEPPRQMPAAPVMGAAALTVTGLVTAQAPTE